MILFQKIKHFVPVLSAFALMLTPSVGWAQTIDVTSSPSQLAIGAVYMTAPGNSMSGPVSPCYAGDEAPARYLHFVGKNFNTGGYAPILLIDLGLGEYKGWYSLTPVNSNAPTLSGGPYYFPMDCSKFSLLSTHRLVVSTGKGPVYNDAISFDFAVVGA